jgi:pimeloyl-ACP methyl ester carboxylesterase
MISRPFFSRRQTLAPLAAALVAPVVRAEARPLPVQPVAAPRLPDRYDEPLGIGLEGWPYPAPVRWQQATAEGRAVRMAYMDVPPARSANKRTAVLLHGKNFDSSYWRGPIKDLTEAGYRVVVPDQIGFNKSAKPDIVYTLDLLAQLTINLLSGLQLDRCTFIGHSTGGMLAARLAVTYPQRVERLILESPIGLVDYRRYVPPQSIETLVQAERRRTVASYRAFMRDYFPTLPAPEMEPFVEWRMRVAQSGEYDRFCKAAALTYQMIYRDPVADQFQDIEANTLMIVGERDMTAPLVHYASPAMAAKMPRIPQAAPDIVKGMRSAQLHTVPGAGHVPHLEAPDAFRETMLEFLSA